MRFTKEEIIESMAPCSLLCYTCPGYKKGKISELATQMCKYFEGYYNFNALNLPEEHKGWLDEFSKFHGKLEHYKQGNCEGCRNIENGCMPNCFLLKCTKDHSVNFCGECSEFPCEKTKDFFEEGLLQRWLDGNNKIKKIGFEAFFLVEKEKSHYEACK